MDIPNQAPLVTASSGGERGNLGSRSKGGFFSLFGEFFTVGMYVFFSYNVIIKYFLISTCIKNRRP